MGLNRPVTTLRAHFTTSNRTPSGDCARSNDNANNHNRTRMRVGDQA